MSADTVNGKNESSEDVHSLLKELTTLKEEARLEKSRNADIDCESTGRYVYRK